MKKPEKYCIDCGEQLSKWAKYDNTERCGSCSKKRELNPFYNKKHSKEYKIKMKIINQGKHLTEEHKKKIRENHADNKGKNNPFKDKHHTEESKSKMSLTKGGTGIPYENAEYGSKFTKELKSKIRKRDNYTCQKCNITEEEHLIIHGKTLGVHHIDYNKQNCNKDNLITLCHECNIRVNYNRQYWQNYFENKILQKKEIQKIGVI